MLMIIEMNFLLKSSLPTYNYEAKLVTKILINLGSYTVRLQRKEAKND
jgi:hypothetical protein